MSQVTLLTSAATFRKSEVWGENPSSPDKGGSLGRGSAAGHVLPVLSPAPHRGGGPGVCVTAPPRRGWGDYKVWDGDDSAPWAQAVHFLRQAEGDKRRLSSLPPTAAFQSWLGISPPVAAGAACGGVYVCGRPESVT